MDKENGRKSCMISPFEPDWFEKRRNQGVSYGTSSYGYDIRCANEFKVFTNINSTIIVKNSTKPFVELNQITIIPPNSFALARTVEFLKYPEIY